jgi:hypothetical protein
MRVANSEWRIASLPALLFATRYFAIRSIGSANLGAATDQLDTGAAGTNFSATPFMQ